MTIAAPLLPPHEIRIPVVGGGGGGTGITKEKCERGEMFSSTEGWEIHRTRMQRGLGKEKPQLTLHRRSTVA